MIKTCHALTKTPVKLFSLCVCLFVFHGLANADEEKITYDQHILPLFRQHCGSCHNANDQKGGLVLDSFTGVMTGGGSGNVVEPGEADASYLFMLVTHESEPVMPPGSKIPQKDIDLLKKWIDLGALENAGSKVMKKKESNLGQVEISTERPADAPVMPEGYSLDPVLVASRPNSVTAISASPWAPLVAVAGIKQVLLYNTSTLELIGVLEYPEGIVERLAFSRNGRVLMAGGGRGGANGLVVLWDVKSGERIGQLGAEYDTVLGADVSSDQTKVVLGGPKRMMRVYSIQTGELVYEKKKHTDWMMAAEFSPDSVLLATSDRSNGLLVWEAYTGNEYLSITGHSGSINDLSWRLDSNILASGSEDSTIRLWELNDGKEVKRWNAHGGGVTSIEFTRDGRIVSTGRDRQVKLWQADGKELGKYNGLAAEGMVVTYDNENKQIIAGDRLGNVLVWKEGTAEPVGRLSSNPPKIADQLAAVVSQLQQMAAEMDKLTAEKTTLNQQLEEQRKNVQGKEAQLNQAKAKLKEQNDQMAQNQAVADKAGADLKQIDADLKKQTQDVESFKKVLNDLIAKQNQLTDLTTQKQAVEAEIASLPAEDQRDDSQIQKATELSEKLNGLSSQIDGLNKELAGKPQAQQNLDGASGLLAKTESTRQEFEAKRNAAIQNVGTLKKGLEEMTLQLPTHQKAFDEAQKSFNEFQATHKQKVGEIDGKLNALNARKQHLEARHQLIQKQVQAQQQQANAG